ncbi:hypothetical protein NA57DRAFT_68406 [Rhizodiscina lignyota]|uniref:tRNA (guanine-N(7)-)-methyltransferase n=1 Tax=Rhizodiscina lignyota TaxID=1504668 RepID=A0A9P4M2R9_9PEZI|nr:hypothetical protein NA57DRAFT_68406 [Rhizodiscina lignyota]
MKGPPKKKQKREDYRSARVDGENDTSLPSKKFYRQRAHANPFADKDLNYPTCPKEMNWGALYPFYAESTNEDYNNDTERAGKDPDSTQQQIRKNVEVADIGCGFGGLLFGLAPVLPDTLIVGMEIRTSVAEFVQEKIKAMRSQASSSQQASTSEEKPDSNVTPTYQNIACLRANTMKFLPNFFTKSQLHSIFLCFPDPHFKARKHKARIVSTQLNSEYAYALRPGGIVYTITDVEDLHQWMVAHFDGHESFVRVQEDDMEEREKMCVKVMSEETEEGKKVERNGGLKLVACFRRLEDPPWPGEEAGT